MAKWLTPARSGQIYRNSAGRVYTGTAGVPVFFEDADAAGAVIDGWVYAPTAPLEAEGKLIPVPAGYAMDNVGNVLGLAGPSGASISIAAALRQSAIAVILAPNGTVAANGTITLGTALPTIYASAWVYLPAGAVVGGAAGLYYSVFTSTTAGTVYTNFASGATAFTSVIPTVLTAAVGSGSAYTQTTAADVVMANINIPGGSMGANGAVRTTVQFSNNNSAGNKIATYKFAGVTSVSGTFTTTTAVRSQFQTSNRGNQSINVTFPSFGSPFGTTSNPVPYTVANTAVDQTLVISGQIATATDYLILEAITTEIIAAA